MFGITRTTYLALVVLCGNEIEAFFGFEGLLGSTNHNLNYEVYWNVPTFMCHKYGMHFEEVSRDYHVIQNPGDDFRGNEIVMLYDPGMFPALLKSPNGSVVQRNGGVPQEGNLQAHLELFREQVVEHIPNDSFRGLSIIDFESWRPIFRQNWASLAPYRELSEKIVKSKHPNWNEKSRKREAAREFEKWGKLFMEETLKTAKATRPHATWGYYAYPYCYNYTPNQNSAHCPAEIMDENDKMSWLFSAENVLLPSVYLRSDLSQKEKIGLINGRVTEAIRISKKMRPRTKVLAYFWYKYQDRRDRFLSREDIVNALREIMDRGADGYVIWGSSFDLNSREKCQNFRDYLNEILGPAILESREMANQRFTADEGEVAERFLSSPESWNNTQGVGNQSRAMLVPSKNSS